MPGTALPAPWRLAAGPLAGAAAYLLLGDAALSPEARRLGGIMACTCLWWGLEAFPLAAAALLGTSACVVLGVAPAPKMFAPYADPIIFLFLGSFWIARAMELHGLDRRLSLSFLSLDAVHASPARLLAGLAAAAGFLSLWLSNTATTAMLLPVVLGMIEAIPEQARPEGFEAKLLLMLAFSASVGGLGTPVGTPPNLIGLGLLEREAGIKVDFIEWMALALPVVVVVLALLVAFMSRGLRRTAGWERLGGYLARERSGLGPWKTGEKAAAAAFAVAVALWLAAGAGELVPALKPYALPEGVSAVLAASLLFVLPASSGRPALPWKEAVRIDWGTLLLFGGGMSLGAQLFSTGLAEHLGRSASEALGATSPGAVSALSAALALVTSQFANNTASANIAVPTALALAAAAGVPSLRPALSATFASSFGFLLPVSTAPNALVYGTGRVPLRMMAAYGAALDAAGFVVIWLALALLAGAAG